MLCPRVLVLWIVSNGSKQSWKRSSIVKTASKMARKRVDSKTNATTETIDTSKSFEANFPRSRGSVSTTTLMPVLRRLTRNRLQFMLKERGLPVTGKRKNMVLRWIVIIPNARITIRPAILPRFSLLSFWFYFFLNFVRNPPRIFGYSSLPADIAHSFEHACIFRSRNFKLPEKICRNMKCCKFFHSGLKRRKRVRASLLFGWVIWNDFRVVLVVTPIWFIQCVLCISVLDCIQLSIVFSVLANEYFWVLKRWKMSRQWDNFNNYWIIHFIIRRVKSSFTSVLWIFIFIYWLTQSGVWFTYTNEDITYWKKFFNIRKCVLKKKHNALTHYIKKRDPR